MNKPVLDASSLLALIQNELGADTVAQAIQSGAVMSTVNLAEVVGKLRESGADESRIEDALGALRARGLRTVPFEDAHALLAGYLRLQTRRFGLSLADRACLALGMLLGCEIVTADRVWLQVDMRDSGARVTVIR